jgi:hypothetical protein
MDENIEVECTGKHGLSAVEGKVQSTGGVYFRKGHHELTLTDKERKF